MAHLTLQLGAAIVVPFGIPRRASIGALHWRRRALREAAIDALGRLGGHRHWRRMLPSALPSGVRSHSPSDARGASR